MFTRTACAITFSSAFHLTEKRETKKQKIKTNKQIGDCDSLRSQCYAHMLFGKLAMHSFIHFISVK